MSIKKLILQLQKYFNQKFPELDASFYVSKRNMCVNMGLEKAIFSYSCYKLIIEEYSKFFKQHLSNKFQINNPPLIHTAKWKFDYVICRKKRMSKKS